MPLTLDYLKNAISNALYLQLTTDTGEAQNDLIAIDIIAAASDEVKNILSLQYTADQVDNSPSCVRYMTSIARYQLYLRRSDVPPNVMADYQNALARLMELRDGTAKLADVPQLLPFATSSRNQPSIYERSGFFAGPGPYPQDSRGNTFGDFGGAGGF